MFSSTPMILENFASATTGAINFLPDHFDANVDTQNERTLSSTTAQQITNLLNGRYPTRVASVFGASCTVNAYMNAITASQSGNDKVVAFSKGHRGIPYMGNPNHIGLVANGGSLAIDHNIYQRTSSKMAVTFIWHCQTAYPYTKGGTNTDTYGAKGMPFAWTTNNNMDKYSGNAGSQVYLGWTEKNPLRVYNYSTTPPQYHNVVLMGGTLVGSPQYEWYTNPTYNYAHVAYLFWSNMNSGKSTYNSLNDLSYTIYNRSFTALGNNNNDLYNWLIVYGNWNMGLPP